MRWLERYSPGNERRGQGNGRCRRVCSYGRGCVSWDGRGEEGKGKGQRYPVIRTVCLDIVGGVCGEVHEVNSL